MNNLATTLSALGRGVEARPLFEKVLAFDTREFGERHRETLTAMHNLACATADCGDIDLARRLQQRAWELHREGMGESHPDTLRCFARLAAHQPDVRRRLEMFESVLTSYRAACGNTHPSTLVTMEQVADVADQLGDFTRAPRTVGGDRRLTVEWTTERPIHRRPDLLL